VNFSGRPSVHFILIVRRKIVLDMGNLFRIPFTGSNGIPEGPSDMGIQRTRLAVFSGISFPNDMRGSPAISATQRLKMCFLMIKHVSLFLTIFQILHTVGVALLMFAVLPTMDAVKGAMLTNAICVVPGVLSSSNKN
jgi:hypothetical protein